VDDQWLDELNENPAMSFSTYVPTLAPEEHYEPRLGPRVWAGAILMSASFGFLLLAGCFAIGILIVINPSSVNGQPPPDAFAARSPEELTFLVTLYILTGLSVLAAAVLFFMGLVGLVRILYGKATHA
jgi:hypothetical protein